ILLWRGADPVVAEFVSAFSSSASPIGSRAEGSMSRLPPGLTALLAAIAALAIVYACEQGTVPTSPDLSVTKSPKLLTVTGSGSGGSGRATGATGIDCAITLGAAATTGCQSSLPWKSTFTLTASADLGDSFAGWSGDCSGTAPCGITMIQPRTVTARFNRGSYQLTVTGQGSGNG